MTYDDLEAYCTSVGFSCSFIGNSTTGELHMQQKEPPNWIFRYAWARGLAPELFKLVQKEMQHYLDNQEQYVNAVIQK